MTLKPEHIVEELNRTPKLKRDLIMKMVEVMLDSEAFLEAYPRLYDLKRARTDATYREKVREEMAWIIVRMFCKNRVHPDDARDALSRAREYYWELCMHSDRAYSIALASKGGYADRHYNRGAEDDETADLPGVGADDKCAPVFKADSGQQ